MVVNWVASFTTKYANLRKKDCQSVAKRRGSWLVSRDRGSWMWVVKQESLIKMSVSTGQERRREAVVFYLRPIFRNALLLRAG